MMCVQSSRVIVAASFAVALVAALQTNLEKMGRDLPSVENLVGTGTNAWEQMLTVGQELTKRLKEEQTRTQSEILSQQKAYSQRLDGHRATNKATTLENDAIRNEIMSLHGANTKLQLQADTLVHSCGKLREDIKSFQGNVSVAAEFLEAAIDDTYHLLDTNASELLILNALDEKEKAKNDERERTLPFLHAAMLQTGPALQTGPQDVMHSMVAELLNISSEQNASMMQLQEKFDMEDHQIQIESASLLDEQSLLNASRGMENNRKTRLYGAVEHLRSTHERLSKQAEALRQFAKRLGHGDTTLQSLGGQSQADAHTELDAAAKKLRIDQALILQKRAESTASLLKAKAKKDGKASTKAAAGKAANAAAAAKSIVSKLKSNA